VRSDVGHLQGRSWLAGFSELGVERQVSRVATRTIPIRTGNVSNAATPLAAAANIGHADGQIRATHGVRLETRPFTEGTAAPCSARH
jgi:hypothetical protein